MRVLKALLHTVLFSVAFLCAAYLAMTDLPVVAKVAAAVGWLVTIFMQAYKNVGIEEVKVEIKELKDQLNGYDVVQLTLEEVAVYVSEVYDVDIDKTELDNIGNKIRGSLGL